MRYVEARITVDTTPQRAVDAFTDPAMLAGWWGVERALVEKHPGGTYALAWEITAPGFKYVAAGVVATCDVGRLDIANYVYFNPDRPILGAMRLSIRAREAGDACEITVRQDGYADGPDWDWYHEATLAAWPRALEGLKAFLEQQAGGTKC